MIAHTSWVVTPRRSRLRGLGQLTPEQQWLNANPQCVSGGNVICPYPADVIAAQAALPMSRPSPAGFLPAATTQTAQNPTYSTQTTPGTPFMTKTFDLNSYMAQWAAETAAFPSSIQGQDPVSAALAVGQSYCATEGVTGCSDVNAIAAKYGAQVKAAIAAAGGAATTTGTTYTQQNSSNPPPSPGPGYVWDGTSWRLIRRRPPARGHIPPSPGPGWVWDGASWRYTGSSSTVVNPSPATQTTTDGSSLTSPTSVLSLTNGASVQTGGGNIIPGIPNAAVFIGGGAAVVLLMLAVQR